MKASNFVLDDYLKRIGFTQPVAPNIQCITALMQQQLYTIPFENLDVQAGKLVSLEPEDIVEKVIYSHRGGYCYELNSIFAMVLESLGITYDLIAARSMFYPARRPRTHMVLVFQLEGRSWLCDLGFGNHGLRQPIALDSVGSAVEQGPDTFQLQNEDDEFILSALIAGEWQSQYAFYLQPQHIIDFMPANYMNSSHPDTIFVKSLLIMLQTPTGRRILFGDKYKVTDGTSEKVEMIDQANIETLLEEAFSLSA